jgi:hypothetical protein
VYAPIWVQREYQPTKQATGMSGGDPRFAIHAQLSITL